MQALLPAKNPGRVQEREDDRGRGGRRGRAQEGQDRPRTPKKTGIVTNLVLMVKVAILFFQTSYYQYH